MIIKKLLFAVVGALTLNAYSAAFERGEAKFDIRVVDELGTPVPAARVFGGAWWPDREKIGVGKVFRDKSFDVQTDTNGMATVSAVAYVDVGVNVIKTNFYRSEITYTLLGKEDGSMTLDLDTRRWLPWPAKKTIVLKRIRNPIPMYIKGEDIKLPVEGKPVGYDLMKGDWVSPYGKGINQDFLICVTGTFSKVEGQFGGYRPVCDLQMNVTFSNPGDGIQTNSVPVHNGNYMGSRLVTDHEAPADGYSSEYTYQQRVRLSQKDNINSQDRISQIAYFRVRTKLDEKGEVKSAMYGFVLRDFKASYKMDGNIRVKFEYFLNPDGTRNVECEQGTNLLR